MEILLIVIAVLTFMMIVVLSLILAFINRAKGNDKNKYAKRASGYAYFMGGK